MTGFVPAMAGAKSATRERKAMNAKAAIANFCRRKRRHASPQKPRDFPFANGLTAFLAALTRYRLWDVEILTRETAALLGAAFLGAGLFSLAQVVDLGDVLPGIPYGRGLVEAGAGLLIALTFFPVRRGLSTALARVQYGERFGERQELLALVRELARPPSRA